MFLDLGGLSLQTRNKGIDPSTSQRDGHADCERILANFASQAQSGGKASNSNDYFDNILFQATVRGRQMCEEAIEADGNTSIRHSNPSASDDEVRKCTPCGRRGEKHASSAIRQLDCVRG